MRRLAWVVTACAGALLISRGVRADAFHYQSVPLGERALGMGGAFTGLANDPSATYYNPGGLARLDDFAISASITLNALDRVVIPGGFLLGDESADLRQTSRPTLPVFAAFVKQLRWREGRVRRHAVAFTTLTFDRRRVGFDASLDDEQARGSLVSTLTVHDERSERWYGPSYGYRISKALSVGISAFVAISRLTHSEERLNLILPLDLEQPDAPQSLTVRSSRTNNHVYNGVFRLGVVYAFSARLRVGAMFQPPSFRFKGTGSVRERLVSMEATSGDTVTTYYDARQGRLTAHDPLPWELRLGVSWAPNYQLLLAFDMSMYGRRGSASDPVVAIGPTKVTEGTDRAPEPGDLFAERWWTRRIANVSAGFEKSVREVAIVRGGAFTDLSAAPNLPKTSDVYRPADIHRLGCTASVGLLARGYDVSLGAAATFGWGKTFALVADDPVEPYRRTRIREQTFFVFLSGARRAAGKLAEDTYEVIRERVRQRRSSSVPDSGTEPEQEEGTEPEEEEGTEPEQSLERQAPAFP
jgi:hypothetical protein